MASELLKSMNYLIIDQMEHQYINYRIKDHLGRMVQGR